MMNEVLDRRTRRELRKTLRHLYRAYRWNAECNFEILAGENLHNIQIVEQMLRESATRTRANREVGA